MAESQILPAQKRMHCTLLPAKLNCMCPGRPSNFSAAADLTFWGPQPTLAAGRMQRCQKISNCTINVQYGHCLKQSITMVLRGCMAWFYSLAMIFGGCPNHFFWGKIPHFPKPTEVWSRVTTICSGAAPWDTLALSEASWFVAEWPPNPRTWGRVESQSSWLGDSMGKSANKSATQLVELVQWKLNPNFLFMRLIVVALIYNYDMKYYISISSCNASCKLHESIIHFPANLCSTLPTEAVKSLFAAELAAFHQIRLNTGCSS